MNWFQNFLNKRRENQIQQGFNYAAGQLLEKGCAVLEELWRGTDTSMTFGDYGPFDEGVRKALRQYQRNDRK